MDERLRAPITPQAAVTSRPSPSARQAATPPSLTGRQYDEVVRRLTEDGVFSADGLEYEICFGSEGNLKVSQVWDSQEQMDAFGQRLGPILAEVGIDRASQRSFRCTTPSSARALGVTGPVPSLRDRESEPMDHQASHPAGCSVVAGRARPRGDDAARMALVFAGLRVFVGVIWLANLSWKLPPDFGRHDPRGLLYSFRVAEHWALVGPLRHVMRNVVIPHFTLFGWLVFSVELAAGMLLTFGVATRVGALLGTGQALIISTLVGRAPTEWIFGYAMFVVLNALPFLAPTSARLSIDHLRGRA